MKDGLNIEIIEGDCIAAMKKLPAASVDAIVTDPPYGLEFMGKEWDVFRVDDRATKRHRGEHGAAPAVLAFQEWSRLWACAAIHVLKPGGHLLAFGGSRTYHRMACAVEDAGFAIRDQIMWLYGNGFPKSLNVSKAIDRVRDDREGVYSVTAWVRAARDAASIRNADIDEAFGFHGMAGHWTSSMSQPTVPTLEQIPQLLTVLGDPDVPDDIAELLISLNGRKGQPGEAWFRREIVGRRVGVNMKKQSVACSISAQGLSASTRHKYNITASATTAAREWDGWGTALKPAHEPIVVARKPVVGTVAANVQKHGTGALNVEGCRVRGRWPANIVLDPEAGELLDMQTGTGVCRFFYCPKPTRAEREAGLRRGEHGSNHHPTVKPVALMRHLMRLVTPPGGTVLDPFVGSGTTLLAAGLEGFNAIGIEQEKEYIEIATARLAAWRERYFLQDCEEKRGGE